MNFKIDYEGLYLQYSTKTEHFDITEMLSYKTDGQECSTRGKDYTYQIFYSKPNSEPKSETSRQITGMSTYRNARSGTIRLEEFTWQNKKLIMHRENEVAGTIEELVARNAMGLEMFDLFRDRINALLPFQSDIIPVLFSQVENKTSTYSCRTSTRQKRWIYQIKEHI